MTRMEFSGFIRHSRLCIFQMWIHTVRKVDQPRGALAISEHRLETSLRMFKIQRHLGGLELDLNGLRNTCNSECFGCLLCS